MRIDPLQPRSIPTAVSRVQRSRAYADYKLQEEHDALLYTGADKQDDRKAASEAAQAISALIKQLSILAKTIVRGLTSQPRQLRHKRKDASHTPTSLAADFQREFEAAIHLFDEHPCLRQTWKKALSDSFQGDVSHLFDIGGPASAVQKVIQQIERTPASMLVEPRLLARMMRSTGYSYSPHARLQSYSTMIHSLSLLIHQQG